MEFHAYTPRFLKKGSKERWKEESLKQIFKNYLFIYLFIYFIYLFLAALGLRRCAQAFSSCGERGLLFVMVCGLLIAVASLVAEYRL